MLATFRRPRRDQWPSDGRFAGVPFTFHAATPQPRPARQERRSRRHRSALLRQRPLLRTRGFLPRLAATGAERSPRQGHDQRSPEEVQDSDADHFAAKLQSVFRECRRILKDDGLLVFTYHHSRDEGWKALADAVLGAASPS